LEEHTKRLDAALTEVAPDLYEALKRNDQRPLSGELARESPGLLEYMVDPAKFEGIQKAAIALLIETHCVAREPIERWPVRLKRALPTDKDLNEPLESAFEGYRAEAIRAWNLISDPPRRSPTTQQPLYPSKTPSTSSPAFEIKVQGHENQDIENQDVDLLESLHGELLVASAKVRMIGTLKIHGINASYYYDPQFTSLKEVASELSSRFDLLRCHFTNLSY